MASRCTSYIVTFFATNVIIGTSGQVKLIDFGIARQGTAIEDEAGNASGQSILYVSRTGTGGPARRALWTFFSLGTILYEITVGRRLWRGSKANSIRRIVEEKPAPPTYVRHDYPSDLEMIVIACAEKKPEDRSSRPANLRRPCSTSCRIRVPGCAVTTSWRATCAKSIHLRPRRISLRTACCRRAFLAEGDEDGRWAGAEALDFDQAPSDGPGAALARGFALPAGPALWVDGRARGRLRWRTAERQGVTTPGQRRACGHGRWVDRVRCVDHGFGFRRCGSLDVEPVPDVAPDAGRGAPQPRPEGPCQRGQRTQVGAHWCRVVRRCAAGCCCGWPGVAAARWLATREASSPQMAVLPSWAKRLQTLP